MIKNAEKNEFIIAENIVKIKEFEEEIIIKNEKIEELEEEKKSIDIDIKKKGSCGIYTSN